MAKLNPRLDVLPTFLAILPFLLGIVFYSQMPETMMTHWNAAGEPNGYLPKLYGLFFLPLISFGIYLLLIFIPRIDPLKKNIDAFKPRYMEFISLFLGFLLYVYILTLVANLGYAINITLFMIPALSVLMYYVGSLLEHSKRNFFIGARTPWTLSSDAVWNKTNKMGARLFRIYSVFLLLSLLFPRLWLWIVLAPVLVLTAFIFVYSYWLYNRSRKTY